MAWKEKKLAEKEEQERKRKRAAEEAYRRSGGGISGRALFDVDASIFIDDEEGVEEYEFEDLEVRFVNSFFWGGRGFLTLFVNVHS